MKEIIEQILPLWRIESRQILQIYPSAWEINSSYVIKVYDGKNQLERNIKISEILSECAIPVAKTVLTKTGEKYVEYKNLYFLLSEKLQGSNITDFKTKQLPGIWAVLLHGYIRHLLNVKEKLNFGIIVCWKK